MFWATNASHAESAFAAIAAEPPVSLFGIQAPTIERMCEPLTQNVAALIPEVRRQTRRRRLWIVTAIIAVVALLVVAVGISGASAPPQGRPSLQGLTNTSGAVIFSTNADAACSSVVSNLGDFKYPNATYAWTGAYTSTASQMNQWDQAIAGSPLTTNTFTKLPQTELLDVCFVSGTFSAAPGAPVGGYKSAVMVVLPDGTWVADSFDYASKVPFNPPPTTSS